MDTAQVKERESEAMKGDEVTLALRNAPNSSAPLLDVKVWSDSITSTFTIPTTDTDDLDIPAAEELEFSGSALVAVPMLRAAIQKLGDSVSLTLLSDRLLLESYVDKQLAHVKFPDESDHLHAIRLADGPVKSKYSKDYLEIMKRLKHTVRRLRLRFGNDFPLELSTDGDRFDLKFILAPRIEAD